MSFASDLKRIVDKRAKQLDRVARGATFEVGNRIVIRTPVDTGAAWGNWLWAVDSYDASFDENKKGASQSLGSLSAGIASFNLNSYGYFTNSLPYIQKLEDGYSLKAPAGMVAISAAEFDGIVAKLVRSMV